jgi:hypothetical protein
MKTGYEHADTAALERIRENLLGGLERVGATVEDGTFLTCGEKGAASPAQAGHLTRALLIGVVRTLVHRNVPGQQALLDELTKRGAQ